MTNSLTSKPSTRRISPLYRKVAWRILPILILLMLFNILDRVNIGFAASDINSALGMTLGQYGLGAGLFFIAYFVFEVPSNVMLNRLGARIWLSRIAITWGLIAAANAFIQSPVQFYLARFLLGAAEAGLYPGVILYLMIWTPPAMRAQMTAIFTLAVPVGSSLGSIVSSWMIQNPLGGLEGWRSMLLLQGLPTVVIGILVLIFLTSRPSQAGWLSVDERHQVEVDSGYAEPASKPTFREDFGNAFKAVRQPRVILLGLSYIGYNVGTFGIGYFLPLMVQGIARLSGAKFDTITSGLLIAIPYAIVAVAMIFWNRLTDRVRRPTLTVVIPMFAAAVAIGIAGHVQSPYALLVCATVALFGGLGTIPGFWKIVAPVVDDVQKKRGVTALGVGASAAASIALINSIGSLGGFGGPYVMGALSDLTGDYAAGLLFIACVTAAGSIGIAIIAGRQEQRNLAAGATERSASSHPVS